MSQVAIVILSAVAGALGGLMLLWIWLKANGLKQQDLAFGLGKSHSFVSMRLRFVGFSPEEQEQVLRWARSVRPESRVRMADLFEAEAA